MKNNILLLTIFILSLLGNTTAQECLTEGIKFENQKQIDEFPLNYPGCIEIVGDVLIESDNAYSISNLDSLSQIISIGGYLKILKNESLKNLHGLNNLSYLGRNLDVVLNKMLPNLEGLNNLTTINEYLKVNFNPSLTSLIGLDGIKTIHNNLSIRSNNALSNLHGLEMLDSVKGNFGIIKNESLLNLEGLNNLISIGESISIRNNNSLKSLSGLHNLKSVNGVFDIYDNPSLHDFSTLENVIPDNQLILIIDNQKELEIRYKMYVAEEKSREKENFKSNDKAEEKYRKKENFESNDKVEVKSRKKENFKSNDKVEVKYRKKENFKSNGKAQHKIWISSMDKTSKINGYLLEAKDSSIVFSSHLSKDKSNIWAQNIGVNNIKTIKYRKNGSIGKGFLYGALAGFAVGALLGLASGDDPCVSNPKFLEFFCFTAEQKALMNGIILTIPGSLIGGMVGAAKIQIPINGSQNTYKSQRDKLEKLKVIY